ncbi:hypothetical protein AAVH_23063 [Aphelenchoides avenae]|nr:hypothetical protein AAVH_23063 [Aphelenchus avenae]
MTTYFPLEETWRRTRQFFSFHQDETGRGLAKIDLETLASSPYRLPQESVFCTKLQTIPSIVDNSTWQPSMTCYGRDEPNCFHGTVGDTLIIIKNQVLTYNQIDGRPDLQAILQGFMRLHIRSFGQIFLWSTQLVSQGTTTRMDAILKFLGNELHARHLDYDIAQATQHS